MAKPPEWSDRVWDAYNKYGKSDSLKVEMFIRFIEAMIKLERPLYKKVADTERYRGDLDLHMSPRDELINLLTVIYRIHMA